MLDTKTFRSLFSLRFARVKILEPQYYIDETPTIKETSESNGEVHEIDSEVIDLHSIHPNLSVKHTATTVKQCFVDLRDSLKPFAWSEAQQHIHHSINEKEELSI